MTRSASICCSTPSPPHFGQAPNGLLNENSRGSISGMVKPDTGQANFSEKVMRIGSGNSSACGTGTGTTREPAPPIDRGMPASGSRNASSANPARFFPALYRGDTSTDADRLPSALAALDFPERALEPRPDSLSAEGRGWG